jgi:1,4-dihydroxy-2-naphthoate octaprenyltransferase
VQRATALQALVVHLRLPFQLLLAPVFLWGWLLSGGGWNAGLGVAFVAFHVCLYGGATAFNSYYDRDVGPVGGLARPPPATSALLPWSVGVQALGWLAATLAQPLLFWVYGGFVVLSVAYSHPRLRLKARPIGSLVVVGLGQGVLAFLGAWAANRGELASAWSTDGLVGALAAALVVVGLYPLTQLFQIEEDRARGDRTLAVAWGPRLSFAVSLAGLLLGGLALSLLLLSRFGVLDGLLISLGLSLEVAAVLAWARTFDPRQIMRNYRHVMRLNATCAGALSAYFVLRLLKP